MADSASGGILLLAAELLAGIPLLLLLLPANRRFIRKIWRETREAGERERERRRR